MSDTQGFDVSLTIDDTRTADTEVDQAVLSDGNVYLAKFDLGISAFAMLSSGDFSLHVVADAASGLSLRAQLIADDWQPSRVTGSTLPGVTGPTADTGVLGALTAGDAVTFDLTSLAADAQDGTTVWRGIMVTRLDAGADVAVWTFNAIDDDLRPDWEPTYAFTPETPTSPSPADGAVVSGSQVPLRFKDYAVDLDELALSAMEVQWSTAGSEPTIVADDTQAVSVASFDMTATQRTTSADGHTTNGSAVVTSATAAFTPYDVGTKISGTGIPASTTILTYTSATQVTMSANATATATTVVFTIGSGFSLSNVKKYWRGRVKTTDDIWSPWSAWSGTLFVANPALAITNPPPAPGNISLDPDPETAWTFAGTQAAYQVVRTATADPSAILNILTAGKVASTAASASIGAEVPDYSSYQDTVRAWDNLDREAVPGFPAYSEASVVWSVGDDATVHAPDNTEARTLLEGSPFGVITWTFNKLQDFRVRRRLATELHGGDNISGLVSGNSALIDVSEGVYTYQWIDWTAAPGSLYAYRVQTVTDHRGSAGGDWVSLNTGTDGAYLVNPKTGDWLAMKNCDVGTWLRPEPTSSFYGQVAGSALWKKSRGNRMGVVAPVSGELWPTDDYTVNQFHRAFENMGNTDDKLMLLTPHESVQVQIIATSSSPMDHFYLPRKVEFTAYQAGDSTLFPASTSDGQDLITGYDYEEGVSGAALTTSSPGVRAVGGSPKYLTRGTLHDQTMVAHSGTGGTWSRTLPNNRGAGTDSYLELTLPSSGKSVFGKLQDVATDDLFSLRLGDDGKISLFDNLGGPAIVKTTKVYVAGTILRVSRVCSNDGVNTTVEYRLRYDTQIDTDSYSEVLSGSTPDTVGPFVSVVGNSGGEIHVYEYEGRIANSPIYLPAAIPEEDVPSFNFIITGGLDPAGAIVSTVLDVVDAGVAGAPGDLIDLAVSTSADMSGHTLVGTQPVSSLSIVKHTITGKSANTRYYVQPATSGGLLFGEVASFKTLPSTGAYTLKIGLLSCQDNGTESPGTTLVNQDIVSWGPDINQWVGDSAGYWGGTIAGTDQPSKDVGKYRKAYAAKPATRAARQCTSSDDTISDHELYDNSDYNNGSNPNGGAFGDPGAGIHDSPMSIRQLVAHQALFPVRTWGDVRSPRRHRGYTYDIGAKVRVIVTDFRTPDRSNIPDADGVAKQMFGAIQHAWIKSTLSSTRVNLIVSEANWLADPAGASGETDKPWSYFYYQQDLADFITASGAYSGGSAYKVAWLGGDRHFVGYLAAGSNTLGGFPVFIGSGLYKNSLPLLLGETMTWQVGADRDPDTTDDQKYPVAGYMQLTLTYDGATTVTLACNGRAVSDATMNSTASGVSPNITWDESAWTLDDVGTGSKSWTV